MSRFSGKCDLFDHICMEKTYEVPGGYESDELECFNVFKERTGGVIYQVLSFKLTGNNIENECKENKNLSRVKHTKIVPDKRVKSGKKEKVFYTYTYYGKEYNSLTEINNYGYWRYKAIHFETLLDIIPYYPYLISMSASSDGKEFVVISDNSFVETAENESISYGHTSTLAGYYRKELQNHYKDVITNYNL